MDDVREIEQFLNKMMVAAREGMTINSDMVYANLIRLGRNVVNNCYINNNFSDWIASFKNVKNINVFVSDNWRYFCQFVNDDYNVISPYNMIKMYIPVDDAHINEAAKRIFSFMARNGMIHHSKIGSEVRFDDIVIRISNEEDAKKIEEFVMNDPYIKEGLMKPNPFAFNNGFISYAWDGELSFNSVIASYVSNCINDLKNRNQLNDVSYKGFVSYVVDTYNTVFKEGKNIDKYIENMEVDEEYQLENYQKVTELLLQSMMPDKHEKNFFDIYNNIVLGKNNNAKDAKNNISIKQKEEWSNIYSYLISKYGYLEANQRILLFIQTNDYSYFTRDNGIRNYLIGNNVSKEMMEELFLASTKGKREILANASYDTYQKYDYTQILVALQNAVAGYYQNFTNANNGRNNMENNINPNEIYGLIVGELLDKGYDINECFELNDDLYQEYLNVITMFKNSKSHR